jgi:hypothetical protein
LTSRAPGGPERPLSATIARWRVPVGFACGLAALWLARPTIGSITAGGAIALVGEAIRMWAAGHLEKSREVTCSGPYRWTGHPLYVGTTVMGIGLAVAARSLPVAILAALYLATMIPVAIRSEEATLRARFGERYDEYRRGVVVDRERVFSRALSISTAITTTKPVIARYSRFRMARAQLNTRSRSTTTPRRYSS